jgi:hypothetical protein
MNRLASPFYTGKGSLSDTVSDTHALSALELVKISVRYTVIYTLFFTLNAAQMNQRRISSLQTG